MTDKAEKKNLSWRETIRIAWKAYRRLYSYVLPYKGRFFFGLFLGFLFGVITGCLPWAMGTVTGAIFHGAAPSARALTHRSGLVNAGGFGKIIFFPFLPILALNFLGWF